MGFWEWEEKYRRSGSWALMSMGIGIDSITISALILNVLTMMWWKYEAHCAIQATLAMDQVQNCLPGRLDVIIHGRGKTLQETYVPIRARASNRWLAGTKPPSRRSD